MNATMNQLKHHNDRPGIYDRICAVATVARRWTRREFPPSGDGSYDSDYQGGPKSLAGLFAGVVAITGLLPHVLCAESEFVEQFKFSGGIVVAIDFDDGKFIADLATDGPFVVHALLRDEARVAAVRQAIQAGRCLRQGFLRRLQRAGPALCGRSGESGAVQRVVRGAGGGADARAGSRRSSRGGRSRAAGRRGRSRFPTVWTSGTSSCMAPTTTVSRWMMSALPSDSAGTTPRNTDAPRRCPRPSPTWSLPMACC